MTESKTQLAQEDRKRRVGLWIWWLVLPLSLLMLFFGIHSMAVRSLKTVPLIETSSKLKADYGPWLFTRFFPVQETILEVIQQEQGITSIIPIPAGDPAPFWEDAGEDLPPVAEVSPTPTSPPPATAVPKPTDTPEPPPPPTATKKPKKKPTKTSTNTPLPTDTPTFTPLPTNTFTPVPPTATFTSVVPPTATFTPIPPADCSKVNKTKSKVDSTITWEITNNNSTTVTLTQVTVTWNSGTADLKSMSVKGTQVFSDDDVDGVHTENGSWSIDPSQTIKIVAKFNKMPGGEKIDLTFSGCN